MIRRLLIIGLWLLPALPVQAQDEAGDLLGRINGLRASLHLPGYRINGALSAAARNQAQWMVETGSISHVQPDGSRPRDRAVRAGYATTDVSENIYGGSNASANDAWIFWINSPIHYRGLTNARYQEVGIGIAGSSWGQAYVLVFGNPGGPRPAPPPSASSDNASANSEPPAPPSYVVGIDPHGFIMHEIQAGDTLGNIALLYGYTWDDIPYMREVNVLADNLLQVGEILLVPPQDGTFTPTPGGPPETTATPENEVTEEAGPTNTSTVTFTPSPVPTRMAVATAAAMPESIVVAVTQPTATPVTMAQATSTPLVAGSTITNSDEPPTWLIIALVMQVGLLLIAGVEFIRRARRRR